ncbi:MULTISPECIES: hypothetical protein [Methanosarcina]|nr:MULTISPECIES: hypothetical protein [Methanosarcina]
MTISASLSGQELAEKCAGLMQELREYISILAVCELAKNGRALPKQVG